MGLPTKTLGPQPPGALTGLSGAEAQRRLQQIGPNQAVDQVRRPARQLAARFWSPTAGLLALGIILELALGKPLEALVIAVLLMGHVVSAFLLENYSKKGFDGLIQRLTPTAQVLRDGAWQVISAAGLVPGDLVYLRAGDRVPADVRLITGLVAVEAANLNGEIVTRQAAAGDTLYAGAMLLRGEATGEVTATGARTASGKPNEWVHFEGSPGRLQRLTRTAVKTLALLDVGLIAAGLVVLAGAHLPLVEIIPFGLVLLIATLPAVLPQTFDLASAMGLQALEAQGVLMTRLGAIEDTAEMQVVCVDKSGTLTENHLMVGRIQAYAPYGELDVLHLAAMASDETSPDAIDQAILERARAQGVPQRMIHRRWYAPSEPARRHSEAVYEEDGDDLRVIKGAPAAVLGLAGSAAEEVHGDINSLSALGSRVIAVAVGTGIDPPHLAGLVAMQDPPRSDALGSVRKLHAMGVKVVMISSEPRQGAQAVARQVGLRGEFCSGAAVDPGACDVYAEILPEDKFNLVRAHQQAGYRVGVTGDSLHDAPALLQAEVGVAVAGASDAAKGAASLVLTQPGLANLVSGIVTSRQIAQRLVTASLQKIVSTSLIALILGLGLLLTGSLLITPLLAGLLVLSNDFTALLAVASDPGADEARPLRWEQGTLWRAAASLALPLLALLLVGLWFGQSGLHLALGQLQTLLFVLLAFSGQAVLYLVRERGPFWQSPPGKWLVIASVVDVLAVMLIAGLGILAAPLPLGVIVGALLICLLWMVVVDLIKVRVLQS